MLFNVIAEHRTSSLDAVLASQTVWRWDWRYEDRMYPMPGETDCSSGSFGFERLDYDTYIERFRTGLPGHYIEVPYTKWGDYIGSTVERANYITFIDQFPNTFVDIRFMHSSHVLLLPLWLQIDAIDVREFADALQAIAGLNDYPLIDDESLSNLESDILEHDFTHGWIYDELERILWDSGLDRFISHPRITSTELSSWMNDQGKEVIFEDAVSSYISDDDLIAFVAYALESEPVLVE